MASLANLIRGTRLTLDLTLEELSRASGVSTRAISDIERGVSRAPQRRTIEALADAMELADADRSILLRAARTARSGAPAPAPRGAAPELVSDFTGRSDEVATIAAALAAAGPTRRSTIVVSGAPGFGKTTIALEAVARGADHDVVCFAGLGGTAPTPRTPFEVLLALLEQVGGNAASPAQTLGEAARLWSAALDGRRAAVVLDDAADEEQVRPILVALGTVAAVVTSRRSLAALDDVTRVTLSPFEPSESDRLVRRIVPASQLDRQDVAELARLCGDVPLALRIAANRLASRPDWVSGDLVARLRDERTRIRNLAVGDRAVEPVFALSYEQLDAVSRRLFRRLAVIDGQGFAPELVASFAGCDAPTAEDSLDGLADLGLVQAVSGGRYRLHDLLKVFATDRLLQDEGGVAEASLRARLHGWLLERAVQAGRAFDDTRPADGSGPFADVDGATAWLRSEASHWSAALRGAAARGDDRAVVDTTEALHWFSDVWPEWGLWHDVFALGVDAARALGDPAVTARQLGYLAWAQIVEQDNAIAASATAALAVDAAEQSGSVLETGWAHYYVQWSARRRGDHQAAIAAGDRVIAVLEGTEHDDVLVNAMRVRAIALGETGRHADALTAHAEVLAFAERGSASAATAAASAIAIGLSRGSIARELLELGDLMSSIDWATVAVEALTRLGYHTSAGWALAARAMALERAGFPGDAARDARETLRLLGDGGDPKGVEEASDVLARVERRAPDGTGSGPVG